MPLDSRGGESESSVALRMLGEYSTKVSLGLRGRRVANSGLVAWLAAAFLLVFAIMGSSYFLGSTVLSAIAALPSLAVVAISVKILRTISDAQRGHDLELAVWQLRRVYGVASRLEDIGRYRSNFGQHLEFELRLSEAQFLLNQAEKLGITEATVDAEIAGVLRARSKGSGDNEPGAVSSEDPSQTPSVMKMAESP